MHGLADITSPGDSMLREDSSVHAKAHFSGAIRGGPFPEKSRGDIEVVLNGKANAGLAHNRNDSLEQA